MCKKPKVDLGWMSGWKEDPPEVVECQHQIKCTNDHKRCVSTCWCDECGFKYKVDSSG